MFNYHNLLILIIHRIFNCLEYSFYSYNKDFAKQRYNTPYACNVI